MNLKKAIAVDLRSFLQFNCFIQAKIMSTGLITSTLFCAVILLEAHFQGSSP